MLGQESASGSYNQVCECRSRGCVMTKLLMNTYMVVNGGTKKGIISLPSYGIVMVKERW